MSSLKKKKPRNIFGFSMSEEESKLIDDAAKILGSCANPKRVINRSETIRYLVSDFLERNSVVK